jgi:hypothetical protein
VVTSGQVTLTQKPKRKTKEMVEAWQSRLLGHSIDDGSIKFSDGLMDWIRSAERPEVVFTCGRDENAAQTFCIDIASAIPR